MIQSDEGSEATHAAAAQNDPPAIRTSRHVGPSLVAVAHGTRSEIGTATVRVLLDAIRAARPEVHVVEAWVDVRQPDLPSTLEALHGPVVVVPMLLSVGYHVRVDIPAAAASRLQTVITLPLGPDPLLAVAAAARLIEARVAAGSVAGAATVILAAAGSTDPDAASDIAAAASLLAANLGGPVVGAALSASEPTIPQAAESARGPLEIANYLLAEGYFDDRLHRIAADLGISVVGAPLGAHPALVELTLARYDAGARELATPSSM
jgi:sirohydrochlorin ferrochelatase